jgi:hypothetical protein
MGVEREREREQEIGKQYMDTISTILSHRKWENYESQSL